MNNVLVLPENINGRDFVVGDIHGVYDLLEAAMKEAQFDPAKDRLICVGDLIDRGPDSARCLEFLQQPWFFALRGNHEDMFMNIVQPDGTYSADDALSNLRNGMAWVFKETPETLAELRAAFEALPVAIETTTSRGTVGFVHAEVPAGMDWGAFKHDLDANNEKTIMSALWSRVRIESKDASGVAGIGRVFSGHTPQKNGPQQFGNCYYMDTGGVFRVLRGDFASEFFLTMADITAKSGAFPGVVSGEKKIITDVPDKKKPFGKYPPKP